MHTTSWLLTSALLAVLTSATPTATPAPAVVAFSEPLITPAVDLRRRQVLSSLTSAAGSVVSNAGSAITGDVSSILNSLVSGLPSGAASNAASGDLALNLPTGGAVQSSLSLNDSQVQALPTQGECRDNASAYTANVDSAQSRSILQLDGPGLECALPRKCVQDAGSFQSDTG